MKIHAQFQREVVKIMIQIIAVVTVRVQQAMPSGGFLMVTPLQTRHPNSRQPAHLVGFQCQDEDRPVSALVDAEAFHLDTVDCDVLLDALKLIELGDYQIKAFLKADPDEIPDEDDF